MQNTFYKKNNLKCIHMEKLAIASQPFFVNFVNWKLEKWVKSSQSREASSWCFQNCDVALSCTVLCVLVGLFSIHCQFLEISNFPTIFNGNPKTRWKFFYNLDFQNEISKRVILIMSLIVYWSQILEIILEISIFNDFQ